MSNECREAITLRQKLISQDYMVTNEKLNTVYWLVTYRPVFEFINLVIKTSTIIDVWKELKKELMIIKIMLDSQPFFYV